MTTMETIGMCFIGIGIGLILAGIVLVGLSNVFKLWS